MRRTLLLLISAVSCAFSQGNRATQAPSGNLVENTPETVIAVINGKDFTVGDLGKLLPSLPPNLRQLVVTQPKTALEQYALGNTLAAEAEKRKLTEISPYREELENARRQVLTQAVLRNQADATRITDEEIGKHFEANRSDFRQAEVRIIFVSRAHISQNAATGKARALDPEEIKKKAETAAKLASEGGDFAELAKKYSDDQSTAANGGLLPFPIRANSQNIPQKMRDAVLTAEPDTVVGPLEHDTGWYIFRVVKTETPELSAVRDDIEKQLKDAAVRRWVTDMQTKSSVSMQNQPFWDTFIATNKTQDAASKTQGGSK